MENRLLRQTRWISPYEIMTCYRYSLLSIPLINKGVYEYWRSENLRIPLCEIDKLKLMMVLVSFSSILKNEKQKLTQESRNRMLYQ